MTDDIRSRRLSGRHQISVDGKHLVDGLAFGRPWLRAPRDRPTLELPPLKRARIGRQEIDEPEQLLLEGPSAFDGSSAGVQAASDDERDDDEDEDYNPGYEVDESLSDDSDNDGDVDFSSGELDQELAFLAKDRVGHADDEILSKGLQKVVDGSESKDDQDDNHSSANECSVESLAAIRQAFPLLSFSTIEKELFRQKQSLRKTYDALRSSTAPSLSFDDMMDRMVTGLLEQNESSPVQPGIPDLFGRRPQASKSLITVIESVSVTSTSESNYDDSSDDSSDDDDDDDDDESNEDRSSYDEDSSDSSDEDSEESSDASSDDSASDSDASESESERVSAQMIPRQAKMLTEATESAPYTGLTRTQKRNARRKRAKLFKEEGTSTPESGDAELLARKQALLGTLSEGPPLEAADKSTMVNGKAAETPEKLEDDPSTSEKDSSAQRRARVDMGVSRRMLFGALGLKNPKSKADEERIKNNLMKDVKPLNNSRIVEVINDTEAKKEGEEDGGDSDAWKSKITYRAVECCHEGMVLSEPPFPFVQRWDPQQQYGSMRKRKRESQAYYDDSYVDESSAVFADETESNETKGNSKKRKSAGGYKDPFGNLVNGVEEAADDAQNDTAHEVHDTTTEQDLPALPEDVGSLAVLEKGNIKDGMVITWKQCIMSKATQWQPVIASVTGEVLPGSTESSLEVRLAFRDREYKEKIYDDKGQRVYDKFEVPDFDDDEEDEDDGLRTVLWDEMIEPKVLQEESPWGNGDA